jgi:nitrogenase molybdenum-iron protein beta chain
MKAADGCKIFGAHQALAGIQDGVVLLHSVVGCNFGSMAFHAACDMTNIRQTCTVISDSDVVFGGEASLARALSHVEELYHPEMIFVVTGCVSDIIQDDVAAVLSDFRGRALHVEAAGYRGGLLDGYEAALSALAELMDRPAAADGVPSVNLLGLGTDDCRVGADTAAFRELLGDQVRLHSVFAPRHTAEIRAAPEAGLNLVLGRGVQLAQKMEGRFHIPMEQLDYPYGFTGAEELWSLLERRFSVDYTAQRERFRRRTADGLRPVYGYLQALYGMPAAVIAGGARSRGMVRFLTRELGMEIVCQAERERLRDVEDFYDQVRGSEAAVLFGSSFERELADELEIPLLRFDYPVFDRVCVTNRPYLGAEGTLCLIEDILNEIMGARRRKGALYQ